MSLSALVVARLRSQAAGFKTIEGALHLASANVASAPFPMAHVLLLRDRSEMNSLLNATSQRLNRRIQIVVGLKNQTDPRGEAAGNDLETLIAAVRAALIGWSPAPDYDPFEHIEGGLLKLENGLAIWGDDYQTRIHLRNP